jgi:hypothetical protein
MTARRPRPPIPLFTRLVVAARTALDLPPEFALAIARDAKAHGCMGEWLEVLLGQAAHQMGCPVSELRFDHEPALRVRPYNPKIKNVACRFIPPANDVASIILRPHSPEYEGSHHVKTVVRGDHGQYSDVVLIKRERRRERGKKKPRSKIAARKQPWPKGRKMRSR